MSTRASNGSISRLSNNRYKITITIGYDPHTGRQKRKSKTIRGSRRVAERELAKLLQDPQAQSTFTLGQYAQKWLEDKRESVRGTTWNGYLKNCNKIFASDLQYIRLADIYKCEFRIREFIKQQGSTGAQLNAYKTLRQVLNHARRSHIIPYNVMDLIEPPRLEPKEKDTITSQHLQEYLDAVRDTPLEACVLLMLGCGLRRSEALALTWSDIDLEEGRLEIAKTVHRKRGGGVYFDKPKTIKSRRDVVLPAWVLSRLREVAGVGYLYQREGKIGNPELFSREWKRLLKHHNLPFINIKNLRHSCGTMLIREAGVSVSDVQQLLGHTTSYTTENFYVQKSDIASVRVADAMSKMLQKN